MKLIKKITDHTTEFNKLKLAQADLVKKTDFDNKLREYNKEIVSNETKNLLVEQKLNTFEVIFVVKIILMKMVPKIGLYFNQ